MIWTSAATFCGSAAWFLTSRKTAIVFGSFNRNMWCQLDNCEYTHTGTGSSLPNET